MVVMVAFPEPEEHDWIASVEPPFLRPHFCPCCGRAKAVPGQAFLLT